MHVKSEETMEKNHVSTFVESMKLLHGTRILEINEQVRKKNPEYLKFTKGEDDNYVMFCGDQPMTKLLYVLDSGQGLLGGPDPKWAHLLQELAPLNVSGTLGIILRILEQVTGYRDVEPYSNNAQENAETFVSCWKKIAESKLNPFNHWETYKSAYGESKNYPEGFAASRGYFVKKDRKSFEAVPERKTEASIKVITAKLEPKSAQAHLYLRRLEAEKAIWLNIIKIAGADNLELLEKIFNTDFKHTLDKINVFPAVSQLDDAIRLFKKAREIHVSINSRSEELNGYLSNLKGKRF